MIDDEENDSNNGYNPFIHRADIIPDMSTFGTSKPGGWNNPNHDGLPDPSDFDDDEYNDLMTAPMISGNSAPNSGPRLWTPKDRGDLHFGIADAVGKLNSFKNDLANGEVFETYPNRLAAETRRIRHEIGGRIADGRKRDLFDDAFELMSKNTATEIRGIATERMVAKNRAGLAAALDTYADMIARSGNAVTTDFAGNHGLNAIDSQVRDGVIDEAEAARLGRVFMVDIDDRSAMGFIQDDPDAALAELALPESYPNLTPERTHELTAHAGLRREAAKLDAKQAEVRAEQEARREQSRAADGFEADYRTALVGGTATLTQISDGALKGTITPARAQRLTQAHETAQVKRDEDHRLAGFVSDALETGNRLDPNDPDHIRAVDNYFTADILPGLVQAKTLNEVTILRDRINDLGVAPPDMARRLDLWWRSGDPRLALKAALFAVPEGHYSDPDVQDPPHRPGDPPLEAMLLPYTSKPGMKKFIQLVDVGMDPEKARLQATEMAVEVAAKSEAQSAGDGASEAPDPDDMLDKNGPTPDEPETFELTDENFGGDGSGSLTSGSFRDGADSIIDGLDTQPKEAQDKVASEPESTPRPLSREELDARTEAVQQLYRDALNPDLDSAAQDAEFKTRAAELGLDPDRAELHRDIARVSPETEASVRARIEEMTKPGPSGEKPAIDPIYRVVLDRKVKDNLGLTANDPDRAFVAGRMANLLGRKGVNVTQRVAGEDLGLAAGIGAFGKGAASAAASRGRGTRNQATRTPGPGRESDFPSPKEYAAYQSRVKSGMPLGFATRAEKQAFTKSIADPLEAAGYKDAKIAIRGSAVTGAKFNPKTGKYDGPPFDKGRVSDHDIAIVSPSLAKKAERLGVPMRNNGRRTVELNSRQLTKLGIKTLPKNLAMPHGARLTKYMIYQSSEALSRRGPFVNLK